MQTDVNSPLRYPGGKSILSDYFYSYIRENNIENPIYAEPYCGGAGAAINLLLSRQVDKIILNDADLSIYAFWYSLKYRGEEFIDRLKVVDISLDEWLLQKEIFRRGKDGTETDMLTLGFATFFLNRCNRSGILAAGPIGGKTKEGQEKATYKIDARFKKDRLIEKIKSIINSATRIEVYNLDALSFLRDVIGRQSEEYQRNTLVYLDPPYFCQGSSLYMNYYQKEDHECLRDFLARDDNHFKWLLSYDNVKAIRSLYHDFNMYSFYINYSAQQSKLGSEILVRSNNSVLPESNVLKTLRNNKRIELFALD